MAVIHPETYAKLRPIFLDELKTRTEPGADVAAMMRAIVKHLAEASYSCSDIEELRSYVTLFVREVRDGLIDPFPKGPYLAGLEPAPNPVFTPYLKDLFSERPKEDSSVERALIDQMIAATKLYDSSEAIQELFAFTVRLREFVYQLAYNRNHAAPTRFVTVAHELAHLYLGHLGADNGRRVPDRRDTPHALMEVEAEMAAYLVAMRNGLTPRSESYLSNYKGAFEDLNLYAVTRTANAVETAMGISAQKLWNEKA